MGGLVSAGAANLKKYYLFYKTNSLHNTLPCKLTLKTKLLSLTLRYTESPVVASAQSSIKS